MTRFLRLVTTRQSSGEDSPTIGEPPFEDEDGKGHPPRKEVPKLELVENHDSDAVFGLGDFLIGTIEKFERDP